MNVSKYKMSSQNISCHKTKNLGNHKILKYQSTFHLFTKNEKMVGERVIDYIILKGRRLVVERLISLIC